MSYFSLRALTKSYDSHAALQEFSLELSKGEFVSIIGESGSGKSTLLRIAAGLLTQSSGEVVLDGKKIENPATTPAAAKIEDSKVGDSPLFSPVGHVAAAFAAALRAMGAIQ